MFLKIYVSGCLAAGVLKATKTYIHAGSLAQIVKDLFLAHLENYAANWSSYILAGNNWRKKQTH